MDTVGQIMALIAIPATLVLVIQTLLLLFGIGGDDMDDGIDLNDNGMIDTPGDGGGDYIRKHFSFVCRNLLNG